MSEVLHGKGTIRNFQTSQCATSYSLPCPLRALRENAHKLRIKACSRALQREWERDTITAPLTPAGSHPGIPNALMVSYKDAPTALGFANRVIPDHFVGVNKMVSAFKMTTGGI